MTDPPTKISIMDIKADADWLAVNRATEVCPEYRLLAAILQDAIHQATNPDSKACLESRDWLEATTGEESVFSFATVCEALGLEPSAIMRRVRGMPGYSAPAKHRRPEYTGRPGRAKKAA